MKIRDRVKELRRVKASELRPSPHNWRTHPTAQMDALRGILAEIGFAGASLARELPGGDLELIDGHARAEVSGDEVVPVLVLDLSEEEAKTLLAIYDPIGAMAEADQRSLDALIASLTPDNEDVANLLDQLKSQPPAEGWGDVNGDKTASLRGTIVHLVMDVCDVSKFESLVQDAAEPSENPIATIMRGLDAINPKRPEREGPIQEQARDIQDRSPGDDSVRSKRRRSGNVRR